MTLEFVGWLTLGFALGMAVCYMIGEQARKVHELRHIRMASHAADLEVKR